MTVSLPPQPNSSSKDAQAARKRRRRAPAGGAADDCFACIKRNAKCDRRRPYCSQCLEIGNECSGYKTQLTWGVGVASRGKLRGLSLPIAKAPPVAPAGVGKKTSPRARANSTFVASQWAEHDERLMPRDDIDFHADHPGSLPATPYAAYHDFARFSQGGETTPSVAPSGWASMPYSGHHTGHELPRIHKLNTSLGHFSLGADNLSSSVDSLSDIEYAISPLSHSFPREEMPFMNNSGLLYENYNHQHHQHPSPAPVSRSPASAILIDQRGAPTSCPSLVYAPSEHGSSLSSHQDGFERHAGSSKLLADSDALSVPDNESYSTSPHSVAGFWAPIFSREDETTPQGIEQSPQAPSAASLQVSPDLISKMPFFMDYYENIMCPSMVLIDGPHNPFRHHVLRLAASSRSLQHAICALSACNLRMKRRLSLGHDTRESPERFVSETSEAQPDDLALSEEYQHRNLAVHLLNEQLNDHSKSCHDSVLATILLLCHYRMVESGIAKFQTQFAGVRKILSMRNSAPYHASSDSAWMEGLFTYFDAISASVNDREAQLDFTFYGASPDSNLLPPGAENLVGCDRELFKTISKLGRLNLLSQHRLVGSRASTPNVRVPTPSSPLSSPPAHAYKQAHVGDFFSLGGQSQRFDGNGFASQLDDEEMLTSGLCSSPSYDDHRSNFWREWKEARTALQTWEFDSHRLAASLPGTPTPSQIRDVGSLSEAFRYAALLYIERLASPNMPSSHNTFRNLVSQVVYYATSLEPGSSAEKFLLWPLFVAGSECVNELQQNIVRNKCREIMSRSGYMNNLSAIDVLERLWAGEYRDNGPGDRMAGAFRRGPFPWARCIGGPGIEVEWMMF